MNVFMVQKVIVFFFIQTGFKFASCIYREPLATVDSLVKMVLQVLR